MKFSALFPLAAISVCAFAQPPTTPPAMTTPDGATVPLEIKTPAPTLPPGRVVLRVGDIELSAGAVDQILDVYTDAQRVYANGPGRQQFIDQLVRVLMLSQEGKRRKLDQTDRYRNQLAYSAGAILASHTDEDIRKQVKVDDAMVQEYMKAHPLDYMQLRARHILIRTKDSPLALLPGQADLTDDEALAKAKEIRQKLVDGADFAKLAASESADLITHTNGGELGFFKRGQIAPTFEEAAFALKAGEISQPVRTSVGYELIQVEEIKPAKPFDELKPEIERNLRNELGKKYVQNLKALTRIEIDPEFASPSTSMSTAKPPK